MPETGTLQEVLTYLFGGGGAGLIAYWLMENVPLLVGLKSRWKRYASLGIAALLAVGAYLGAAGLNYVESPQGWQAWVEALFAIAFVAVGGGQGFHGLRKL